MRRVCQTRLAAVCARLGSLSCGDASREVVFAFPPSCLVRPAVEKACADRALCVLNGPVAILAPHWNKLLAASVLAILAPHWNKLLAASVLPRRSLRGAAGPVAGGLVARRSPYLDGFARIRDPARMVEWPGSFAAPAELS
jgi:hypothetical protein